MRTTKVTRQFSLFGFFLGQIYWAQWSATTGAGVACVRDGVNDMRALGVMVGRTHTQPCKCVHVALCARTLDTDKCWCHPYIDISVLNCSYVFFFVTLIATVGVEENALIVFATAGIFLFFFSFIRLFVIFGHFITMLLL